MAYCMYTTIIDFFGSYIKEHKDKLGKYQIIVVSRDITADLASKEYTDTKYSSRYKNIDFSYSLFPIPAVMEYSYDSNKDTFREGYFNQLSGKKAMYDLCCIVDLLVNDDCNVILLNSKVEYRNGMFDLLEEFMYSQFHLKMHSFDEFMEDNSVLDDLGNVDEIKKLLDFQIKQCGLEDDVVGGLFNKLYDDMTDTYRQVLMDKSKDELFKIGSKNGLYINKRKPKEYIVEHIMQKIVEHDIGTCPD